VTRSGSEAVCGKVGTLTLNRRQRTKPRFKRMSGGAGKARRQGPPPVIGPGRAAELRSSGRGFSGGEGAASRATERSRL
jgi:hypothetical protein